MSVETSTPAVSPSAPEATAAPSWTAALKLPPWPRLIAWTVLLVACWFFRGFFFVAFLTFVLCWLVRGYVGLIARRMAQGRQGERLERWLTVAAFVSLFLAAGVGWEVVAPRMIRQGQALLSRVVQFDVQETLNQFLTRTVGDYLFRKTYGKAGGPEYDKGFLQFRAAGKAGQGLYEHFPALRASLISGFESETEHGKIRKLQAELLRGEEDVLRFEPWFLKVKAPAMFEKSRETYVARWLADYGKKEGAARLAERQKDPDFVAARDAEIRKMILDDVSKDPLALAAMRQEWQEDAANREWAAIRASPEYLADFKAYYEQRRQREPQALLYDFDRWQALEAAYPKGQKAFTAALGDLILPAGGKGEEKLAHEDFELTMRRQLATHWWDTDPTALAVRQRLASLAPELFGDFESWLGGLFRAILGLPMEIMTAFFLALYITFDLPNMRRRAESLRHTRIGVYYEALAPDLVALARQLGVFFQSRVLVAAFNTILTFFALLFLGIESELLLCLVVFVTSFIPIVGVFIAGVPVVLIAIVQPGGSMTLAAKAAAAITIVHLIEANVFSPFLLAKTAELHPIAILLSLAVGEHFFGMWGLILGVPVAAFLGHLLGGKGEEGEEEEAKPPPAHPSATEAEATELMTESETEAKAGAAAPPVAEPAPAVRHKKKRWRR